MLKCFLALSERASRAKPKGERAAFVLVRPTSVNLARANRRPLICSLKSRGQPVQTDAAVLWLAKDDHPDALE